jgi:hypothetical protein
VTRLGESSPIGWLFALISFMKMTEVERIFGYFLSKVQVMYCNWQKKGWTTLWAIFSQTHLVALCGNVLLIGGKVIKGPML